MDHLFQIYHALISIGLFLDPSVDDKSYHQTKQSKISGEIREL
jgi:hypothetical protein